MAIVAGDLQLYQSANMPEADGTTSGGAITLLGKAEIVDLSANDTVEVLSDGADTRTVTVTGRDAAGTIQADPIVLDAANPVEGAVTFKDILKVVMSGGDGSRTVTVRKTTGDATICTIGPNITSQRRLFYDSASESGSVDRYEKVFWKNEHGTLSLTNAKFTLTNDPATVITIGGSIALDDSVSVADRKDTAPGGVAFVDDSVEQDLPDDLGAGEACGLWIKMSLAGSAAAVDSSFTTQLAGTTAA